MCKVKQYLKEIYDDQIDPDYVNDSLSDINKLIGPRDRSRRNNIRIVEQKRSQGKHGENVREKFSVYLVENLI